MLIRFNLYLDTEDEKDRELIAFLNPYRRRKRTGEVLRPALLAYVNNGKPGNRPAPAVVNSIPSAAPTVGAISQANSKPPDIAAKMRSAFFK